MYENNKLKINFKWIIFILIVILFSILVVIYVIKLKSNKYKNEYDEKNDLEISNTDVDSNLLANKYTEYNNTIKNILSDFDLSFLKLENNKEDKVYSPLSIKYALKMLSDGTEGNSKQQIISLFDADYKLQKYLNNKNMSIANSLFINSSLEEQIKKDYINKLKYNYNAEVIFDTFCNAKNINNWVSDKTLNLINNIIDDDDVKESDFLLINALGIDMEWKNKFLDSNYESNILKDECYAHTTFSWYAPESNISEHEFGEKKEMVSGMDIVASINNYDLVTEIGKDNIIKTVSESFREYAKDSEFKFEFGVDVVSDEFVEEKLNEFLYGEKNSKGQRISEGYLAEIDSNYKKVSMCTDFSLYVDNNVKAFAKDLKEYNGTTLQYIGIMPINENIEDYIENIDEKKINNIIDNLKELKNENFKDGVVTRITGFIPKFKFEYKLNLKKDLKKLGIIDVFESKKANLIEIYDNDEAYIENVIHKSNIEFTQDGIKAAAATTLTEKGAGEPFDYKYDVPIEDIDLTFDKPYMFLIRDKNNGEIWFVGSVYNPLLLENEKNDLIDFFPQKLTVYPEKEK